MLRFNGTLNNIYCACNICVWPQWNNCMLNSVCILLMNPFVIFFFLFFSRKPWLTVNTQRGWFLSDLTVMTHVIGYSMVLLGASLWNMAWATKTVFYLHLGTALKKMMMFLMKHQWSLLRAPRMSVQWIFVTTTTSTSLWQGDEKCALNRRCYHRQFTCNAAMLVIPFSFLTFLDETWLNLRLCVVRQHKVESPFQF